MTEALACRNNHPVMMFCTESVKNRLKALAESENKSVKQLLLDKTLNQIPLEVRLDRIEEMLSKFLENQNQPHEKLRKRK